MTNPTYFYFLRFMEIFKKLKANFFFSSTPPSSGFGSKYKECHLDVDLDFYEKNKKFPCGNEFSDCWRKVLGNRQSTHLMAHCPWLRAA